MLFDGKSGWSWVRPQERPIPLFGLESLEKAEVDVVDFNRST